VTFYSEPELPVPSINNTGEAYLKKEMFSEFDMVKINDFGQFENNMKFNFSGPMELNTHYPLPEPYFNNSMMLNLGVFISDMEI
jgi:hypothetical protein